MCHARSNFVFLVAHVYLMLLLYTNQSIKFFFSIEILLEMVDSSVKSHGEAEYDIQICLRYQEIQVWPKFRSKVYLFLLLYINRSITKKFPTEKLLEMMDSSVRNLGEVESITFKSVLIRNFFVMDRFMYSGNMNFEFFRKLVHNKNFLIKTLLEMIDSTSPRFLTLEFIISKSFSVGNFFVIDRFM